MGRKKYQFLYVENFQKNRVNWKLKKKKKGKNYART